MPWKVEKVGDEPLKPAPSEAEYRLHQAALEWSLADSIVLDNIEESHGRTVWRERLDPYRHQVQNLFTYCRRLPVTLLADDVGLGKTVSAGLILSELMARRRVTRALVLCPKILCNQWVEELEGKFSIPATVAFGERLDAELERGTPVVVTTYESATPRLAQMRESSFELLVLDEAHKLRNLHGTPKPPKMAVSVRTALEARLFRFVVMLTATPMQNGPWDLYSLVDCLTVAKGHANPLGTPQEFRKRYLQRGNDRRQLAPESEEEFRGVLRQYIVRTRREDCGLQFPEREVQMRSVELTQEEKELTQLVSEHIADLDPLMQTSLAQALMSSPQALASQLENMARSNESLQEAAREARTRADRCTRPAKLVRLLGLCKELRAKRQDWRVVVFTQRKETQRVIGETLRAEGIRVGYIQGGQPRENEQSIKRFWANPPEVQALVSTDSGAEGINLQVANVLVNYDLPWNPMVVEQRIGRLQRLASQHARVVVWNLVANGSVEERVVARLMEKLQTIAHAIGDIESILESSDWADDEEGFENQIRDLVVRSLMGQDVEQATRKIRESIEQARARIEEDQEELDRTLGGLDEMHHTGPRMPPLERPAPSLSVEAFVRAAREAEGARFEEIRPGVFRVSRPDQPEEVVRFDSGSDERGEEEVKRYQPGKPEFEHLVKEWSERAQMQACSVRGRTLADAEALARLWCAEVEEGEFLGWDVAERVRKFQGRVRVKVKATNGVDAYEKLLWVQFHPEGHEPLSSALPLADRVEKPLRPADVVAECKPTLNRAVEADSDVNGFCTFYEARRAEELRKAGTSQPLRKKVQADFTPTVSAEVVGVEGVSYDEAQIRVRFSVQGKGEYEVVLRTVPVSGQLLDAPGWKECEQTHLRVPIPCLEACQVTGLLVLKHLLATSQATGRRGLAEHLVTCEITGTQALDDEVAICAVTGQLALRSLMVVCEKTGDWVLATEAGKSDCSGKTVIRSYLHPSDRPPGRLGLEEEFRTCVVSNRHLLFDEVEVSAVSQRLVDRELLQPSERSGRLALAEELVACDESHARLLPEETAICEVTKKRVDTQLLARSEVSGTTALARLMERCAVTNKLCLATELAKCEVSGDRVLPGELETCTMTGKRGRRDRMHQSALSGKYVVAEKAVRSAVSGRLGLPDEMVTCGWLEQAVLRDEATPCALTGVVMAKACLNPRGELGALRKLLDGRLIGTTEADAAIGQLRPRNESVLRGLKHVWVMPSPQGGKVAVCGEVRSWFGMKVRYVGMVTNKGFGQGQGMGVQGYRGKTGWELEEKFPLA